MNVTHRCMYFFVIWKMKWEGLQRVLLEYFLHNITIYFYVINRKNYSVVYLWCRIYRVGIQPMVSRVRVANKRFEHKNMFGLSLFFPNLLKFRVLKIPSDLQVRLRLTSLKKYKYSQKSVIVTYRTLKLFLNL